MTTTHQVALNTALSAEKSRSYRQAIAAYEDVLRLLSNIDSEAFQSTHQHGTTVHKRLDGHLMGYTDHSEAAHILMFEVHFHLGDALARTDNNEKALVHLSRAIKEAVRPVSGCTAGMVAVSTAHVHRAVLLYV